MPSDPLLTTAEVCAITRRHRHTIRNLMRAQRFPAPIIDGKRLYWRQSWVEAWINSLPRGHGATAPELSTSQA
jgi:predicted DNA-binding transcriptional regulator AlpA